MYVIVVVPPAVATPVTTPLDEPTVATEVLLLLHVPPVVESVNVVVEPAHTGDIPPVIDGTYIVELTVASTVAELEQFPIVAVTV